MVRIIHCVSRLNNMNMSHSFYYSESIMKRMIYTILFFLFFWNTSLAQTLLNENERKASKVDKILADWNNKATPGMNVLISRNGMPIYSKSYGSANLEYRIPNANNTIFHAASISKQFTAFAIAMLANQGKLSLEDDIRNYLPDLPDFGKKITIRHLIYHTSGLRDQWGLLSLAGWRSDDVILQNHILKLVKKQKSLNFSPGTEFLYSNTNYTLLAEILQKVTGKQFAEWTKENIFDPLEMKHTYFSDSYEKIVDNRAYSYHKLNDGYKMSILNYATVGATGLMTTSLDLGKWANNFKTLKVGSKEIMNIMHQTGTLNNGEAVKVDLGQDQIINYAFGQAMTTYKGYRLIYHDGSDADYRTYLGRFPEQNLSIILLCNTGSINPEKIALEIADIYLDNPIGEKSEKLKFEEKKETEMATKIPLSVLEKYVGRYEIRPNVVITIKAEGDRLKAQITGKKTVHDLIVKSNSEFYLPLLKASITFQRDKDNGVNQMIFKYDEGTVIAPKLEAFDPKSIDLNEFSGKYASDELSTAYTFAVKDGVLTTEHPRQGDIHFALLELDYLIGDAWFFKTVEIVRDKDKNISGIKVSNGRIRNLWFKKTE